MFQPVLIVKLLFCLLLCNCVLSADDVYSQTENFLRAFSEKCSQKAISGQAIRQTLESCIERNLLQATHTIPESLYPIKFRQLLQACLGQPVNDFCSPIAQANARACMIRHGVSSLGELRRLYDQHRQQIIILGSKISADCSTAIRAL